MELNSALTLRAALSDFLGQPCETYKEVNSSVSKIKRLIRLFENQVWYNGLEELAQINSDFYLDFSFGRMLVYYAGGQTFISLDSGDAIITLSRSPMTQLLMHRVKGTEQQILALLDRTAETWVLARRFLS